ncbi:hypothetical protein GCM10010873_23010 [Cypionkella aquatica]|uniref:Uncharacterized protein n=1 Tax=Cypionkella aquatica TaxID=1756042 RepID=A0AA37U034_9RHOB|nr:hypothetical protein [Cypionkella aquatica]GLS87327.1 hypothetical protein GCM10010873_23010 [Cypionkella aquatica]
MRKLGLAAFAVLVSVAGHAAAKPVLYDCSPSSGADNSIVQKQVLIVHDSETGEAFVNDGVVMHVYGAPTKAKIASESADWVTFTWHIERLKMGSVSADLDYRIKLHKPDGKMTFSLYAPSFSNQIDDVGRCTAKSAKAGKKSSKK